MEQFLNMYLDYWKNFLKFDGRTGRKTFWITVLIILIVSLVVGLLCRLLWVFGDIINYLYGVACIVPSLSLLWRRMQDTGREGWWALIPLVNLIFATNASDGPNKYGPRPAE